VPSPVVVPGRLEFAVPFCARILPIVPFTPVGPRRRLPHIPPPVSPSVPVPRPRDTGGSLEVSAVSLLSVPGPTEVLTIPTVTVGAVGVTPCDVTVTPGARRPNGSVLTLAR
jgi:hypothetical protein